MTITRPNAASSREGLPECIPAATSVCCPPQALCALDETIKRHAHPLISPTVPVKRDPINHQDKFEKRIARYQYAIEMMTEQVAAAGT